jgi:hypothetical protein
MRNVLRRVLLASLALGAALQLVPYGWWHENPPVTRAAVFPSAEAEAIARAACMDCHSNETDWPLYSYVAPMSWLVRRDVEAGRDAFNLSELDREQEADVDDAADEVDDGSMPPRQYELAHPDARLNDEERRLLIDAFEAMDDGRD